MCGKRLTSAALDGSKLSNNNTGFVCLFCWRKEGEKGGDERICFSGIVSCDVALSADLEDSGDLGGYAYVPDAPEDLISLCRIYSDGIYILGKV